MTLVAESAAAVAVALLRSLSAKVVIALVFACPATGVNVSASSSLVTVAAEPLSW